MPAIGTEFWTKKFEATQERDAQQLELRHAAGWKVLTLWECEVKDVALVRSWLSRMVG